jgi:predicted metal-dependent hydrolase
METGGEKPPRNRHRSIKGTEVVMVAPAKATRKEIKQFAAMKLAYVLSKKQGGGEDGEDGGLKI